MWTSQYDEMVICLFDGVYVAQCVTAGGQADLTTFTILTGSCGHISKRGVNDLFQLKHIEILMTSVLS